MLKKWALQMITPEVKNKAMGLLSIGMSVNEVAGELDLPIALVDEWNESIPDKVITKAHAVTGAIELIAKSDYVDDLRPQIKVMLQKTALEVIEKISFAVYTNDLLAAQITKQASDSIAKLYVAMVGNEKELDLPDVEIDNNQVRAFATLTRD
jgi:hypothetical protein